jgi:hypothetical protein
MTSDNTVPRRKTEVTPIEEHSLYRRISLHLLSQFPGIVWLRLEPHGHGPAIMIQVKPGDIAAIGVLGDKPGEPPLL